MRRARALFAVIAIVATVIAGSSDPDGWGSRGSTSGIQNVSGRRWLESNAIDGRRWADGAAKGRRWATADSIDGRRWVAFTGTDGRRWIAFTAPDGRRWSAGASS